MNLKVNFSVTFIFFASSNNSVKMQLGILDELSSFEARTPTCSSCLYCKAVEDISIFIFFNTVSASVPYSGNSTMILGWRGQTLLYSQSISNRGYANLGLVDQSVMLLRPWWLVQGPAHDPVRTNWTQSFFFFFKIFERLFQFFLDFWTLNN